MRISLFGKFVISSVKNWHSYRILDRLMSNSAAVSLFCWGKPLYRVAHAVHLSEDSLEMLWSPFEDLSCHGQKTQTWSISLCLYLLMSEQSWCIGVLSQLFLQLIRLLLWLKLVHYAELITALPAEGGARYCSSHPVGLCCVRIYCWKGFPSVSLKTMCFTMCF